jgi:PAS domain S-box-containing protein
MKLALERQIYLAFIVALILLLILGFFAYRSTNTLKGAIEWEKHTQEVLQQLDEMLLLTVDAETGGRGFVITGNEIFLEPYTQTKQKIDGSLAQLRGLLKDNPNQSEKLILLEESIGKKLNFTKRVIDTRRDQNFEAAIAEINSGQGKILMDEVRLLIGELKATQKNILRAQEAELNESVTGAYRMLFLGSIAGILSLGLANFAIFREFGKRRRAEDGLREANKSLEKRVEERTLELSEINKNLKAEMIKREQSDKISRESEIFTRAILNSLSAHIAVIDEEGKIVATNEAWEKFGSENCSEEQVVSISAGQNYLQVCRRSAAFEENTRFVLENLQAILGGEKADFSLEYPCHSPTDERWFILQVNALQSEKGGAVISHINISDRKKAEVELKKSEQFNRSIFENSPDCVHILELDGTVYNLNAHGLELMEIDIAADYVGKNWVDFWVEEEKEAARRALEQAAEGKTSEIEGLRKTIKGTPKYWHASVAPIFDANGKPYRVISTSRDITDRREAEAERERLLKNEQTARKDAEIANRLRDEFLATVSHELRAPLNSILGWARLLEKGKLDKATSEKAFNTIVRNAESQNRLIEDLLDVSRIISGKLRLEVMTIKPINVVESALETVRPAAEAKGIKIEIKGEGDISHISGDPNRLQQVIWNLLSNAIKFTPPEGEVKLEIEREEDFVEIRVKDTGVGIQEEFLPHVFDRFRQADASSIRKFGGLGLGLAIVRHIHRNARRNGSRLQRGRK